MLTLFAKSNRASECAVARSKESRQSSRLNRRRAARKERGDGNLDQH